MTFVAPKPLRARMGTVCCAVLCVIACTPVSENAQTSDGPKPEDTPEPPSVESRTYVVGVVPQQSASKLAQVWIPLLQHVGKNANLNLKFETAKTIPEFEKRCAEGVYDLAYMNPYHYTLFHESPGYEAIVKQKDKQIQGIVVKRKDAAFSQLGDLNGSELAFPAPRAFAATLLTRAGLDAAEVTYEPKFVSSHDSVYRGVAKGLFPAGGGIVRTFKAVEPEIREQLEILWTTPKYTPHAFAVHPRLDDDVRALIASEFIALNDDEAGRQLLEPLKFNGIESAQDADWNDVRALQIHIE